MKIDFTNNNSVKNFFLDLISLEKTEEIKLILKEYGLWDDKNIGDIMVIITIIIQQ